MGGAYDSDEATTSNAKASPTNAQSPAPKTNGAGKPTILGNGQAPEPKTVAGGDQRDATEQVLNPQDVDLQDADVEVLTAAAEGYVDAMYKLLEKAQEKAFNALTEPPIKEQSTALALLAKISETLAEMVADYVTDGMFTAAKKVFGAALKHATDESVTEVLRNAADEVGKKTGAAVGKQVEASGEHESGGETGSAEGEPIGRIDPAGKTLVDEFAARQEVDLIQRRAKAGIVTASVVSVGRHDRSNLLKFANDLSGAKLDFILPWYQRQIAVQWLNFSALVAAGGKIDRVAPTSGAGDRHDPRMIPDGVIDIEIAIPSQIWGTQGLKLKSMKLQTSSPGVTRILRSSPRPLLDIEVLRRVTFVGNDGKLSDSTPLTIYPDGGALPATDDFYLKAIGKLTPVDSRGGGFNSSAFDHSAQLGQADSTSRKGAPAFSAEQLIAPQAPDAGDGAFALRGADLLHSAS
jgi:hypothetical protein